MSLAWRGAHLAGLACVVVILAILLKSTPLLVVGLVLFGVAEILVIVGSVREFRRRI